MNILSTSVFFIKLYHKTVVIDDQLPFFTTGQCG